MYISDRGTNAKDIDNPSSEFKADVYSNQLQETSQRNSFSQKSMNWAHPVKDERR